MFWKVQLILCWFYLQTLLFCEGKLWIPHSKVKCMRRFTDFHIFIVMTEFVRSVCSGTVLWTERSKVHFYAHLSRTKMLRRKCRFAHLKHTKEWNACYCMVCLQGKWLKTNINSVLRKRKDKLLRFKDIPLLLVNSTFGAHWIFYLFFMAFDIFSLKWNVVCWFTW